jgi:hypothetical protein
MPNSQLFYTAVGLGKETAWGTPASRTVWLPCDQPRFQPKALRHILDTGFRGLPALEFDLIPGPGEGTFSFNGNFFLDSSPNLLMAMFGQDTVTGAADPYTHAITLASVPPSYSLEWQQNVQPYLFAGARLSQLVLNFNGRDGALTYSAQGMSKLGQATAPSSPTFGTQQALAGWHGSITVAGGSPASLLEGSITFSRQLKPIHALNTTQDVAALYAAGLQVTARLTFDYTQTTEWAYYGSAQTTMNAVVITFTQVASSQVLTITMTKAAWRQVDIDQQDFTYTAVAQINGIWNATDGGPAAVTVMNSRATAY